MHYYSIWASYIRLSDFFSEDKALKDWHNHIKQESNQKQMKLESVVNLLYEEWTY